MSNHAQTVAGLICAFLCSVSKFAGLLSGYFFRFFKRVRSSFIDSVDSFRLSSISLENLDEV
jgi:hypothetical protein